MATVIARISAAWLRPLFLTSCLLFGLCPFCPGMAKPPSTSAAPPEWLPPAGMVPRMSSRPVIDGVLKTGEWDSAALFILQSVSTPREDTTPLRTITYPWGWVGRDNANLWVCMVAPKVAGTMRAQIWIDPTGKRTSSIGFCIDERGRRQTLQRNYTGPLPSWQGAAGTLEDICFFEAAIPLSSLTGLGSTPATVPATVPAAARSAAQTPAAAALPRALINLALEIDAATSGEAAGAPLSVSDKDKRPYWRYCWAPAMDDPGFPGCFGDAVFCDGPTLRDAQVTIAPEALQLAARLQSSTVFTSCIAQLDVFRRGQRKSGAQLTLSPQRENPDPFELKALKLEPGLAEWMWTLTDAQSGTVLWRSPMTPVEIPSGDDLADTLKDLSAQVRALGQRCSRLTKDPASTAQLKAGIESWNSKSKTAADAIKGRTPESQNTARKLVNELREDMTAMRGRLKRAYVIPEPQSLVLKDTSSFLFGATGDFRVTQGTRLYSATDMASALIAKTLLNDIHNRFGITIPLAPLPKESRLAILLETGETAAIPGGKAPDKQSAYRMIVSSKRLHIIGSDPAGLWNGTRSLLQLMRFAEGRQVEIPCLEIEDWPQFALRAAAIDASGSQRLTPEYLQWLIDGLSDLKYNRLLINLGARYSLEKLGIGQPELTTENIIALRGYARSRFINMVPMFDGFGRMNPILTAGYAPLRESPDDASTISPLSDKAEEFLNGCVDEIAPAFDAEEMHFGGRGGAPVLWGGVARLSRDFADREGPGALLAWHFNRLDQVARRHNLLPCFWADALMERPDALARLHPGVCLYVRPQREAGRLQPEVARAIDGGFPVVSDVELLDARLLMRSTRYEAIHSVARYARERGSRGLCLSLIENAGDQYLENAWPALAYGAEQMGRSENISEDYFREKLSWIWWNADTPDIIAAMCQPPAMELAPAAGSSARSSAQNSDPDPLQALLMMRPSEAWIAMQRTVNYAALIAEARRAFGQDWKNDQRIMQLTAAGRQNDSHLLQAEFLERLHRHCAAKILALDGAHTEYEAALRAAQSPASSSKSGAAGRPLPEEVIRHLSAAENHCRALVYDYPYFKESFKRASTNMGLRPGADDWVSAGAADALKIYQAVEGALNQARQGVAPLPLSVLAFGNVSPPLVSKRWPAQTVALASAAQPQTLSAEAPLTLMAGQSCYAVWEIAGEGQARLTRARIVALSPDKDGSKDMVLYEDTAPREIGPGAPKAIVMKTARGFSATMLRFEAQVTSAQIPEGSEITLTTGKLMD
ncbi:MAG: hypothetical protein NTX50_26670 [Candidatus Sumerlaeota bacterium]|nr:hypothetical protein [Candidatus Sumerlaeota bacterium]